MTYARYLTAVNSALRDTVLPDLQSGRAIDAVNLSINIIGAIAARLERVPSNLLTDIDAAQLPAELRILAAALAADGRDAVPGPALPTSLPSDDFALSLEAAPLIAAGSGWLSTHLWPVHPDQKKTAVALLAWEAGLRSAALVRVQSAERGLQAADAKAGVPDINQPALEKYLQRRLESPQLRVSHFKFLTGGRTRQTALFTLTGTSAAPSQLVVQRDHPSQIVAFGGAGMQFQVLQHLHAAGMKVAKPILFELAPEALGARFMITEQVRGASPIPSMDYWSAPVKSRKLAESLAIQFGLLHRTPIGGLTRVLARSVDVSKGDSWLGTVLALEQQWRGLMRAPSMAMSAAFAWLRAHVACVDATESIVHGDALLHNTLAENEEITALLDWEAVRIGHPLEDLGYVRPVVEQMTDWNYFLDAYVAAGGRRPTSEQTDFFTLYALVKLCTLVAYARSIFDAGHTNDQFMAEVGASFLPKLVERLATQLNAILNL